MSSNDAVYTAWKNTLDVDELAMVERAEEMPDYMAVQFWGVAMSREVAALRADFLAAHRPLWRQALAPVAVAGAFVAGLLGLDPRGLGG